MVLLGYYQLLLFTCGILLIVSLIISSEDYFRIKGDLKIRYELSECILTDIYIKDDGICEIRNSKFSCNNYYGIFASKVGINLKLLLSTGIEPIEYKINSTIFNCCIDKFETPNYVYEPNNNDCNRNAKRYLINFIVMIISGSFLIILFCTFPFINYIFCVIQRNQRIHISPYIPSPNTVSTIAVNIQLENTETLPQCKICFSNSVNIIFKPCGHANTCIECGNKCNICPICRCHIDNIERIYW